MKLKENLYLYETGRRIHLLNHSTILRLSLIDFSDVKVLSQDDVEEVMKGYVLKGLKKLLEGAMKTEEEYLLMVLAVYGIQVDGCCVVIDF